MIEKGRFTAQHHETIVIFLIGMRVNNWLRVGDWWPVFSAFPAMVRYLYQHPESGFLGSMNKLPMFTPGWREITLVQYWRSLDDLERFARQEPDLHPVAWKRFFQKSYQSSAVGIWHETYQVAAGHYENIYANMPAWGLAGATGRTAVKGRRETMKGRLDQPSNGQPG